MGASDEARADVARYRGPERRATRVAAVPLTTPHLLSDLAVAVLGSLAALGLGAIVDALGIPSQPVRLLLSIGAAVLATVIGVLALVRARLCGDARIGHLGVALLFYGGLVVPTTAVIVDVTSANPGLLEAVRVGGVCALVYLMIRGLLARAVDSALSPRRLALTGGGIVLGIVTVVTIDGDGTRRTAFVALAAKGMLVALFLVAAGYTALGLRLRRQAYWRVGVGLLLIAGAQLLRLVVDETAWLPAGGAALRLVGLLFVLYGIGPDVAAAFHVRRRGYEAIRHRWLEAETVARESQALVAEHEHEIGNALVGIAGATYALGRRRVLSDDEAEQLGAAVQSELARLQGMVGRQTTTVPQRYDVRSVIVPVVAAQRSVGHPVEVAIPAGLRAYGRPTALAQLLVNLLANCARHAPGALVLVTATARDGRVLVTVADDGPGIPAGAPALDRVGRRPASTSGSGLGLSVSARLAEGEGGALRVLDTATGCTVLVELPMTAPSAAPAPRAAIHR